MKLTARDNPETIRRYAHLRRARWGRAVCGARGSDTGHTCGREAGHRGPHAAHAWFGRVVAVWESGRVQGGSGGFSPVSSSKAAAAARRPSSRARPVGLRADEPGLLRKAGRRLLRMVVEIEELALFLMFLAFVYFAVEWLAIIFR